VVAQEVEFLEVLEAKARPAGGVDLDHTRHAEGIGVGTRRCGRTGARRGLAGRRCRRQLSHDLRWSGKGRRSCFGGRRWHGCRRCRDLRGRCAGRGRLNQHCTESCRSSGHDNDARHKSSPHHLPPFVRRAGSLIDQGPESLRGIFRFNRPNRLRVNERSAFLGRFNIHSYSQ